MSTAATPYGAEPIGTLSASGSFTGKVRHIPIVTTEATAIFYGDFVKMISGGTVSKSAISTSVPTGTVGIFMGCFYTDPTTKQPTYSQYWPAANAATDAVAYVCDDPFLVFKMQADESLAATKVGLNCSAISTAGSASIGRSRNALDGSSAATTNTLPFRILELVEAGDSFTEAHVTWLPGKHAYLTILGV
jgi:hypothetical protein